MNKIQSYFLFALLILIAIVWGIYFFGVIGSAVTYALSDIREEGLAKWILGGELKTAFNALAWPSHVYRKRFDEDKAGEEGKFALVDKDPGFALSSLPIKPIRYPRLLDYLEEKKFFDLKYITETGKEEMIKVRLNKKNGVVIEKDVVLEVNPASADDDRDAFVPAVLVEAHAIMMDLDGDSRLDFIEINAKNFDWAGGTFHPIKVKNPKDDNYLFLWNQSLDVIYRHSDCCKK